MRPFSLQRSLPSVTRVPELLLCLALAAACGGDGGDPPVAAGLEIASQPTSSTSGLSIPSAIVVRVVSADGRLVSAASGSVSLAATEGTPGLTGPTVAELHDGIASFSGLILSGSGLVRIRFEVEGLTSVLSNPINVQQVAASLTLLRQPAGAYSTRQLEMAPQVEVRDHAGLRIPNSTLAVSTSVSAGAPVLGGTTTVNAVAGIATFANLSLTGDGPVTLSFAATGLAPISSGALNVESALTVQEMALLPASTCAVATSGSLYCWGDATFGVLGDPAGAPAERTRPHRVAGTQGYTDVAAGFYHVCALSGAGQPRCWGYGGNGQLGGGSFSSEIPINVLSPAMFVDLVAYQSSTCARTQAGEAYCWGSNGNGEIGDGTTLPRTGAVPVSGGHTFSSLTPGCGLTVGGSARCWGRNAPLTDSTFVSMLSPTVVPYSNTYGALAGNGDAICGRLIGADWECIGQGTDRFVGDSTNTFSLTPRPVPGSANLVSMVFGQRHACGLTAGGSAYCWGENGHGQLGDGTQQTRWVPTAVVGGLAYSRIFVGLTHTCGITIAGRPYCWGDNTDGKIGDATKVDRLQPAAVVVP